MREPGEELRPLPLLVLSDQALKLYPGKEAICVRARRMRDGALLYAARPTADRALGLLEDVSVLYWSLPVAAGGREGAALRRSARDTRRVLYVALARHLEPQAEDLWRLLGGLVRRT